MSDLVSLSQIELVGSGLVRPECVVTTAGGTVYVSNFDGGVTALTPNGQQQHLLGAPGHRVINTNGFAILPGGDFLLADLGTCGVWRLSPGSTVTPFLQEIEGSPLPPANFVSIDAASRIWITVSTRMEPRHLSYRQDTCDGFIVLVDHNGPRLVADGLGYTNEAHMDPDGEWLYVNETFARRLSRFYLIEGKALGSRETVWEFGPGEFPDGFWFDEEGGIIVTCIVSNKVIRLAPGGGAQIVISETFGEQVARTEDAFVENAMGREHLDQTQAKYLRNVSSIAFAGEDRKTAYLGCLLSDKIIRFRSPFAGVRPPHWDWI